MSNHKTPAVAPYPVVVENTNLALQVISSLAAEAKEDADTITQLLCLQNTILMLSTQLAMANNWSLSNFTPACRKGLIK